MRATDDIIGKVRRVRVPCVLLGVTLFSAAGVSAQDIGGVIAFPDAPFVIPVPDRTYAFPDYRSNDVLTQRNDNNRSGASYVLGLNQNTVGQFHKLGEFPVDGVVLAQPLYVDSAIVKDIRQRVLIIATSHNDVYAFSPSDLPPRLLWHVSLREPLVSKDVPIVGAACGIGGQAAWQEWRTLRPGVPNGLVGIEATPVIDLANKQVLVGFKTDDGNQHLAAIELNDPDKKKPVVVDVPPPYPNWHKLHRNRASLLLADGVVYLAFAGLCEGNKDEQLVHGSIFAFDAKTLKQVGEEFRVTDDRTDGGGIWQGSTGIAADDRGNLYFSTGNRRTLVQLATAQRPTVDWPTFSNSVIRLKTEKIDQRNQIPPYRLTMKVADYFTPYRRIWQDANDLDLASAGVLLIPRTRYLAAGGKEGMIYVLDRANMGRWDDVDDAWHFEKMSGKLSKSQKEEPDDPHRDNVHQKFQAAKNQYQEHADPLFHDANQVKMNDWGPWPHIHGTPVFARFDDENAFMYVWPEKDRPKKYHWRGEKFEENLKEDVVDVVVVAGDVLAPPIPLPNNNTFPKKDKDGNFVKDKDGNFISETDEKGKPISNINGSGMPGGMLSVNVDLSRPKSGVVFGSVPECRKDPDHPLFECVEQRHGALHAFDPMTMKEIWNNRGMNGLDQKDDYWFAKFVPPTIAAGRVFLPTASGKVIIYGP